MNHTASGKQNKNLNRRESTVRQPHPSKADGSQVHCTCERPRSREPMEEKVRVSFKLVVSAHYGSGWAGDIDYFRAKRLTAGLSRLRSARCIQYKMHLPPSSAAPSRRTVTRGSAASLWRNAGIALPEVSFAAKVMKSLALHGRWPKRLSGLLVDSAFGLMKKLIHGRHCNCEAPEFSARAPRRGSCNRSASSQRARAA